MTEYNDNPLCANFNPDTAHRQNIFLETTRALPEDKRLNLTASNTIKIMEVLQLKEANMGEIITAIPTSWTGGTACNF